jgi:hypothetical protein
MYPKLKFQLNKDLDKKVCRNFIKLSIAGLDFRKEILKVHPVLNNISKKKEINKYIDKYYKKYRKKLLKQKEIFDKFWKKNNKNFFKKVDKIFKNHRWPKGKYICYLSIFPCGPRFLKDKTFQSFYKYPLKIFLQQIIHEMFHFIFYDYVYTHYSKYKSKKYQQKLWEISEAFNQAILNQRIYPRLNGLTKKIKKIWQEKQNIDYLLKKVLPK